ncbi:MAG: Pr6Pr family membrane protein [Nocardioides sp.]
MTQLAAADQPTPTARRAYAVNAGVAWLGVALTAALSGLGRYRDLPPEPGLYGNHADGLAGALPRLFDTFSYFTIWSNVVVAVSATLLLTRPFRDTTMRRLLRLDALLMITVTAIVYQVLLAPTTEVVGWSRLTDPILHIVTPIVTVAVWLVWGPRGWVTGRLLPAALAVPVLWIGWMLVRGAVGGTYPYGFVNVSEYGYASVARTLALILLFGLVVAACYWGLDLALRGRRSVAEPVAEPD